MSKGVMIAKNGKVVRGQESRWKLYVERELKELAKIDRKLRKEYPANMKNVIAPTFKEAEECIHAASRRLGSGEVWIKE